MTSVKWLGTCGKALPEAERRFLKEMASRVELKFPKPTIVNIGVFRCASMYCLRAGSSSARLVGVDIYPCKVKIQKNLNAEFIIADSRFVHKKFKSKIHLLFIDGDHHYETVWSDLVHWGGKVVVGGAIILHDCHPEKKALKARPEIEGVNRAVSEWYDSEKWRELPAPVSLRAFMRLK